jgi:hypothetical protein
MSIDSAGLTSSASSLRSQLASAQANSVTLGAQVASVQDQIATATAQSLDTTQLRQQLASLQTAQTASLAQTDQLAANLHGVITQFHGPLALAPYTDLDPQVPIVMLPVRLETRFVSAGSTLELHVRVFPDDPHIEHFEPELTAGEEGLGHNFWIAMWRSGGKEAGERQAWSDLVKQVGPYRAGWIASVTTPDAQGRPTSSVPDGTPLPAQPAFPTVALRGSAMTRAAKARTLPDRFVALAYVGTALVGTGWGSVLPDEINVGPDPNPNPSAGDSGPLAQQPGMSWMTDFGAAEKLGMAVRVQLAPNTTRIDRLIVFGVKDSLDPASAAQRLANMLDSHAYTHGLSFVAPGTPSNNTPTDKSAWSSAPTADDMYQPVLHPAGEIAAASNLGLAATATGLANQLWPPLLHASGDPEVGAQAMNALMWMPTWGYYLGQMLRPPGAGGGINDFQIGELRRHFIDFVRGQGHYPSLRIGDQPYGLLAVTSLDRWKSSTEPASITSMVNLLRQIRFYWLAGLDQIPRLGGGGDPEDQLVKALSMSARSVEVWVRSLRGTDYSAATSALGAPGYQQLAQAQQKLSEAVVQALGWNLYPYVVECALLPFGIELRIPWTATKSGADGDAEVDSYLKHLAGADLNTLLQDAFSAAPPATLLNVLARHSMLLVNGVQGLILVDPARPNFSPYEGSDLVNLNLSGAAAASASKAGFKSTTTTLKTVLAGAAPAGGGMTVGQYLKTPSFIAQTPDLSETYSAITALEGRGAAELERLLANSLDCASHRLDAWISSVASRRLASLRSTLPTGVYLGAYGWVEDIKQAPGLQQQPAPTGETAPVLIDPNNSGYIHAPSIPQAAAAAVLRSGHVSHSGRAPAGTFSVELTSSRMRGAERILDGVRAGQSLGALLGYQVERGLHEAGLDGAIATLRRLCPEVAGKLTPSAPGQTVETIAARNVVDGLTLSRTDGQTIRSAVVADGLGTIADAVLAVIAKLQDSVDALSELLLSEGVYQLVQGNVHRAAASLDAMDRGTLEPPPPAILSTPRSGVAIQQRVAALIGAPSPSGSWPGTGGQRNRASAEPRLEYWAQRMLPDPVSVRIRASFQIAGGAAAIVEATLADVRLSALDLIYDSQGSRGYTVLEQRLLYRFGSRAPSNAVPGAAATLLRTRNPTWPASAVDIDQMLDIAGFVGDLMRSGREGDASAFANPGDAHFTGIAVAELNNRAQAALAALTSASGALDALVAAATTSNDALIGALDVLASFGIVAADIGLGASKTALLVRARGAATVAHQRLTSAVAVAPGLPTDDDGAAATKVLQAIFGESFRVLPTFALPSPGALRDALGAQAQLLGTDRHFLDTWLGRMAGSRNGLGRLLRASLVSEASGVTPLVLRVAQLPFDRNALGIRWVGGQLSALPTQTVSSFVIQSDPAVDLTQSLAALLIDDWVEIIPKRDQITALSFQADAPRAQAPQAILMAVSPDPTTRWSVDALSDVLHETMDLTKIRAVDLESAAWAGRILPAICLPDNTLGDTIGVPMKKLAGTLASNSPVDATLK